MRELVEGMNRWVRLAAHLARREARHTEAQRIAISVEDKLSRMQYPPGSAIMLYMGSGDDQGE